MRKNHNEKIDKIITLLWINDREEVYEWEEEPEEPIDAIKALTALGKPVVDPLIEILKYTRTYAAVYAIRILGDIGEEHAIAPLITVLEDNNTIQDVWEEAEIALEKFGERAREPILQFLKRSGEEEYIFGVDKALELLVNFKSQPIFEAAVTLLSSKDEGIREIVAMWFGKYGDKRAVPHLKQLLADPMVSTAAMKSLRSLVGVEEYRTLIAPYVEERMVGYERHITRLLNDIRMAYDEEHGTRFLGDDAESLNFVAREDEIMEGVVRMVDTVAGLLEAEVLGTPDIVEAVRKVVEALNKKHIQFEDDYKEELGITRMIFFPRWTQERTYSRLATHFDELRSDLVLWLKQQGFRVVWLKWRENMLFAWKGTKAQQIGCIVKLEGPTDHRRTQGTVNLRLWGEGWAESEMEAFYMPFWERIAAKVTEVGGRLLNEANA